MTPFVIGMSEFYIVDTILTSYKRELLRMWNRYWFKGKKKTSTFYVYFFGMFDIYEI